MCAVSCLDFAHAVHVLCTVKSENVSVTRSYNVGSPFRGCAELLNAERRCISYKQAHTWSSAYTLCVILLHHQLLLSNLLVQNVLPLSGV